MISIDDHPPSDPSSSHHHHQIQQKISHDLKVSYIDLKSLDADLDDIINNNQLPKFSIRDYVSGLRSKDIACNWPFSPTSLQLCLKHGVKNLLPPFQSLDSLRNNSSLTRCSLENRLTEEEFVNSLDGKPPNDQFKAKEKLPLKSITTNSSVSKGQRSKEKPSSSFSQKTESASIHIKKSRLVMKLNSGVERVEDIAPNSFIVSETMASKVCPVCKIFSSSSNTTLNAHIDQCLTGEGTMKWTENPKVIVKYKVKPRKMRLMVDIYKTAPHCTMEELDRRNGTSWATNSSFHAQEFQFQGEEEEEKEEEEEEEEKEEEEKEDQKATTLDPEEKKERKMANNIIPEVANNEGDVYIDTNGTKVRILSVPKAGSVDNHRARKLVKGVKGRKLIMGRKKNNIYMQKHQEKYLKVSPNARKLCSPKPQARNGQGEDVAMAENCRKDERGREPMKLADLAITMPPWACSKRTGLLKKFSGKNQRVGSQCHEMKDLLVESDKTFLECDLGTPLSSSDKAPSSQNRKNLRSSSSLIKQPFKTNKMVEFRKEGTDDDDDDDDEDNYDDDCGSPDASPSRHSDGADTRSNETNISSLTKSPSFPAAKINLKRKFTAAEKSRVRSLLNDISADAPSQDSSKEQSRMEEHSASKSSNEEFSMGIQSVNGDELESVRNETLLSNVDQVCVVPASSFMDLSSSFNPEFSKQECIELYQDQLCSINRAPNDVEKHENYFQEVDPIPIPGPPGSFLPASPGGELVSEEHIQATRVLPSENQHHHDTMDQDSMSNSPVSTISNSRSTSVQDDAYKRSFVNGDTGFTERGLSHNSFKNDQPCCCSRKEVAFNYQDSYISRKQPIEPYRSIPSGSNFKSEMFPSSNYPTSPAPDSAASPSKPVLRLMGKNLTVVKTDEDKYRPPQSSQQHPQRPVIFSQYQNGFEYQDFNVHPSSNIRSHADLKPIHGGFIAPVDRYGHGGPYLGPMGSQARSHHGHNVLDFQAISESNVYNAASSSKPVKEIIIIDDSPEIEADDSMQNEFLKKNQGQMNPVYPMYPSQRSTHPYGAGSSVFRDGGFQNWTNGDLSKWNIGSGASSSLLSPSMAHLRYSIPYYPPSYP